MRLESSVKNPPILQYSVDVQPIFVEAVYMTETIVYGAWRSPLAAVDLARSSTSLTYVRALDGMPYWLESRPAEGGRYVVVTLTPNGYLKVLTPEGVNARSRVHEYG